MAIKLHFTKDSFNVFKNRGVVKGTREAFYARNDRYMFERLARKHPVDHRFILVKNLTQCTWNGLSESNLSLKYLQTI